MLVSPSLEVKANHIKCSLQLFDCTILSVKQPQKDRCLVKKWESVLALAQQELVSCSAHLLGMYR